MDTILPSEATLTFTSFPQDLPLHKEMLWKKCSDSKETGTSETINNLDAFMKTIIWRTELKVVFSTLQFLALWEQYQVELDIVFVFIVLFFVIMYQSVAFARLLININTSNEIELFYIHHALKYTLKKFKNKKTVMTDCVVNLYKEQSCYSHLLSIYHLISNVNMSPCS